MTTLLLIRHGESQTNRQGVYAGQINPDLEEKGVKQAQLTAKFVAENYKVDKIYSSDLKRAYRTALCLGEETGMEVTAQENLREIHGGEWEGMKFVDLVAQYGEVYDTWINHVSKAVCPGGESVKQLGERIIAALTEIAEANDGKTVAIATHGTPIRAMQSFVRFGTFDEMDNIPWVSNASVSVFEYENGKWAETASSLDEHLAELRTTLPKNA